MGIYIKGMKIPKDRDVLVLIKTNKEAIVYEDVPFETAVFEYPSRTANPDSIMTMADLGKAIEAYCTYDNCEKWNGDCKKCWLEWLKGVVTE